MWFCVFHHRTKVKISYRTSVVDTVGWIGVTTGTICKLQSIGCGNFRVIGSSSVKWKRKSFHCSKIYIVKRFVSVYRWCHICKNSLLNEISDFFIISRHFQSSGIVQFLLETNFIINGTDWFQVWIIKSCPTRIYSTHIIKVIIIQRSSNITRRRSLIQYIIMGKNPASSEIGKENAILGIKLIWGL